MTNPAEKAKGQDVERAKAEIEQALPMMDKGALFGGSAFAEILRTLLASHTAQAERIASLEDIARCLVHADVEANPSGQGVRDCIDNDGRHYQSQWLADVIAKAALLSGKATS